MAGQATRHIVDPCRCAVTEVDDDSAQVRLVALVRDKQARRAVLIGALINAAALAHLLASPPNCVLQLMRALA